MTALPTYRKREHTRLIILHDSHTGPDMGNRGHAWLLWHGRKMGLLSTGYHVVIEPDGSRIVTRPLDAMGSATPGHNHESIDICLVGGRDEAGEVADTFNHAQRLMLFRTLGMIRGVYDPLLPIKGHTELQRFRKRRNHPCPAMDMDRLWWQFDMWTKTGEVVTQP